VEARQKDFHRSALAAVESARFKPATKQGQAVAVRVRMPLYYRLGPPVSK
jgi:TonB family protein